MSAYAVAATTDPTSVMGRRIVAFIIDLLIIWAIGLAVFAATVSTDTVPFNPCDDPIDGVQICNTGPDSDIIAVYNLPPFTEDDEALLFRAGDSGVAWLVTLLYGFAVFGLWQGLAGMTPGKALLGIRTVDEQGQAPGVGRALLRWVLMIVDSFCCYLVGLISAFSTKGHRRVGDLAAKTFVVGKESMGSPVVVPGLTPPAMADAGAYAGAQTWAPPTTPAGPPMAPQPGPPTGQPTGEAPGAAATGTPGAGSATEPQWDPARNAYIQWDPTQQRWLQYDDAAQQWRPIDGA